MTAEGEPTRSRPVWVRVARVVYLVALAGLLAWLVWERRSDLAELVASARVWWLVVALALGIGQLLPNVLFWTVALRELGSPVGGGAVLSATARSVPARYLPGSVWYALGRAALLRQERGVSKRSLAAVAGLESTLAVVVAILLGSAALAAAGRFPAQGPWLAAWFVGLLIVGSPPVVNAVLAWVARRRGGAAVSLGWGGWSRLVGATGLHWVWSATTFSVYLLAFPGLRTGSVFEVAGSFLVAWVVGFLALFAPQGMGVFEATVAAMLVDSGVVTVAIVAAGYRALMLVRDVVVFGAASAWRR